MPNQMLEILEIINKLTNDEDMRQELWVAYLHGISISSLSTYLTRLQIIKSIEDNREIQCLLNNPPSSDFLNHFNDIERIILFLLILRYNIASIAVILGTDTVRINKAIVAISHSTAWDNLK